MYLYVDVLCVRATHQAPGKHAKRTHTHVSYSTKGMFRVRSEARIFSHASFHFSCDLETKHNPTILKEIHVASPDETPKVDRRSLWLVFAPFWSEGVRVLR